jgi:hypothetical protein
MRLLSLSFAAGLGVALFAAACEKTVFRAYDSQYCSSKEDDEPYYECAKGDDLVCINTYDETFGSQDGRPPVTIPVYACHLGCDPHNPTACQAGEVCCPGKIYGRTYNFDHACTLPRFCAGPTPTAPRDGAARDSTPDDDARDGLSGGNGP